MVNAEVASGGELSCDGRIVGRLQGFRFTPETTAGAEPVSIDGADVASAIAGEFDARATRLSEAVDASLVLANDGAIRWLGDPVAKIVSGDHLLAPRALILADDSLSEAARQKAQARVDLWLAAYVRRLLGPLFELEAAVGLEGAAHNVASQLWQALGVLERGRVAQDVKSLDQNARGMLRKLGVRFGAYYIYLPNLVKPAIRVLATQLWALRQGGPAVAASLDEIPQLAASGRTSFLADAAIPREIYRVAGFRLCEDRAVRVDIVERLADIIRPAVAYRPAVSAGAPPPGSADGDGFVVTGAMTSMTGCSGEAFAAVLRSLGFVSRRVKGPVLTPAPSPPVVAGPPDGSSDPAAPPPAAEPPEGLADGAAEAKADEERAAPPLVGEETAPVGEERAAPLVATPPEGLADSAAAATHEEAAPSPPRDAAQPAGEPVEDDADVAPPPAAVEEEALIEVWRPRPSGRQRAPRRGPKDQISPRAAAAPEGATRSERRDEAGARSAGGRRRRDSPEPAQGAGEAASGAKEERREFRGGRGSRRHAEHPGAADAGSGRRHAQSRGEAPEPRRAESPPPVRREPPVNLDSPFAKLLALKSQLEAKGKGG